MHATLLHRLAILSRNAVHGLAHALRHFALAAPGPVAVRVKIASKRRRRPGRR